MIDHVTISEQYKLLGEESWADNYNMMSKAVLPGKAFELVSCICGSLSDIRDSGIPYDGQIDFSCGLLNCRMYQ